MGITCFSCGVFSVEVFAKYSCRDGVMLIREIILWQLQTTFAHYLFVGPC